MGNLVWTFITYVATILIVRIIFRVVKDDQARALEAHTRQLYQARQSDRVILRPDEMPRFGGKR